MATTPQPHKKLHFLVIPLMCPGHLIPMVDIARLLAKRRFTVTIVTTPLNAARFESIVDRDADSGLDIRVLKLEFPHAEAGLPEGSESVDTLPSPSYTKNFMHAISLLQKPLESKIIGGEIEPGPSCIIADKHVLWTAETSRKLGVPRVLFDGMSCFALLCCHNLHVSRAHEKVAESEPFLIPGLPDPFEVTPSQLPGPFNPNSDQNMKSVRERVREGEVGAYGFVVNSFEELELGYVKGYGKTTGQKVWCVGPVSLCNKDDLDKAERGNINTTNSDAISQKSSMDQEGQDFCLKWLDLWGPRSVVYACLGSLNRLTPHQIVELGLGLEASKRPFIWVIRGVYKREEIECWLKEDGFEERVKGQGLLIRGWAPQVLILSHPSIGVFLTHCGWNSTLEGICGGVPMVTWPLFGEQFLNERFVVQILKIGVSVGAEMVITLGEEEKFGGVLVKRFRVEEAIEKVMGEGKEGEERRERATRLANDAKKTIEQGGSSYQNITLLLEDIMQYLP